METTRRHHEVAVDEIRNPDADRKACKPKFYTAEVAHRVGTTRLEVERSRRKPYNLKCSITQRYGQNGAFLHHARVHYPIGKQATGVKSWFISPKRNILYFIVDTRYVFPGTLIGIVESHIKASFTTKSYYRLSKRCPCSITALIRFRGDACQNHASARWLIHDGAQQEHMPRERLDRTAYRYAFCRTPRAPLSTKSFNWSR